MIKEVTQFIANKTSFTRDADIFAGWREQDAIDRCQCVLEAGGGDVHFDLPDRADKMVQVLSRAITYFDAHDDAWEIFNAIHGTAGWDLPIITVGDEYVAMTIVAVGIPTFIGRDENGRYEFSTNYIFRIRDK